MARVAPGAYHRLQLVLVQRPGVGQGFGGELETRLLSLNLSGSSVEGLV